MKVWRLGSFSDFNGGVKPQGVYSFANRKNEKKFNVGGSAAFCLPDSFCGNISFCSGDLFAIGVIFGGISDEEIGSFGLSWDDVIKAYEAAGFVETDDEPMVESDWFNWLYDEFASWTLSKLAF